MIPHLNNKLKNVFINLTKRVTKQLKYPYITCLSNNCCSKMELKKTRPVVFCGPSGSGKSSLLAKVMSDFPNKFGFSVSHTTRKPRPGEIHGKHYLFITHDEMKEAIAASEFLEYATFSGNMYGTSKAAVAKVADEGKVCILDIDVQGVKQIKASSLEPLYIFIEPPSIQELEKRLRARNTETEESLNQRLQVAEEELVFGKAPGNFHIIITNDDLEKAYDKLKIFLTKHVLTEELSQNGLKELNPIDKTNNTYV